MAVDIGVATELTVNKLVCALFQKIKLFGSVTM